MDATNKESNIIDENQSLTVIKEMIAVSRIKLRQDGILFIVWGWVLFYVSFSGFITRSIVLTYQMNRIISRLGIILGAAAALFTIYYLIRQRKKVQTYIGISLRYVWTSLFLSTVLVNLIQMNVLHSINFELQHPLFMVLMAFAVTVTGGILRHRLIIIGGAVFGALALTASYLGLKEQLLLEAVAWMIAFIVPGHILSAKRNK
ncbi:MAG: hypothetical protein WC377_07795 [Bacteroidales bacterium]|jgi:hypothetical protein|nr:hypothetical protein [Bacteroidales bacterium]